jgi:signal transduction histidine kinase
VGIDEKGRGALQVGPLQPSGRVIAGGRLLLACLFLIAIWVAPGRAERSHPATFLLITAYAAWSLGVTLAIWHSWWRDARLAAAAHVIDVAVFMLILYATAGYASPYFTFFIFVLLAAAIRWGWKETSVTAGAIITVYFLVGMMLGPEPQAQIQPFIIRTGHLLIISAILIWFGANQWVPWRRLGPRQDLSGAIQGDPFIAALQAGMAAAGARVGLLIWRQSGEQEMELVRISPGGTSRRSAGDGVDLSTVPDEMLFDLARDRVLMRAEAGRWRFLQASTILPGKLMGGLELTEGLAIPIAAGTIEGLAIFQDVAALSTDHLDFAPRLAHEIAEQLQEAALFAAVEEHSMARARVAVARDLHDSVVQFLAGLGFRLEALKRMPAVEGELAANIADLKDTVMTEQRQMRAFIKGLRTGKPISLHDMTRECAQLCQLLSRQWSIDCSCACRSGPGWIPLRTQLDIQHLVREAVANAVRHGGATRVTVGMSGEDDRLCLRVVDNGRGFPQPADGETVPPPRSLSARAREVNGELEVTSAAGETAIVIRLPMDEAA